MRRSITILLFLFLPVILLAQKQNNIWYFGFKAGIDFNGGTPVALTDGAIMAIEGCASIADPNTGKLLFYTDGDSVWNRNHQVMPNGRGLGGHWSSTQRALIVPMPGDAARYYVFTTDATESFGQDGVNYSVVNMDLNGGLGDVETSTKKTRLTAPASEKLCGVRHCNRRDYWVLTHDTKDKLFAYAVTPSGISGPVTSMIDIFPFSGTAWWGGYLKASPDGRSLAAANPSYKRVDLYDFDNATGKASNGISIPLNGLPYGVTFSPDNTKLYVSLSSSDPRILQFDIAKHDSASIAASRYGVAFASNSKDYFGALLLGPDGKIYCIVGNNFYAVIGDSLLSIIEQPNEGGSASTFRRDSFSLLSGIAMLGLPNTVEPVQRLTGPDKTICADQPVVLRASGGNRYQWSPSATLSCDTCPITIASPTQTTTYRVAISGGAGCETIDSVVVTVVPKPQVTVSGNSSICPGGSVTLSASGADHYRWLPPLLPGCDTCSSIAVSPAVTTTYTVIGTNAQGCVDSVAFTVVVRDTVKVDAGRNLTICAGDSVALAPVAEGTFNWSPAEGLSCSTCRNPVARPLRTTLYTVTVIDTAGCSGQDTIRITVSDSVPDVSAGTDAMLCLGDSIRLSGSGEGLYSWTPVNNLSCTDCPNPVALPDITTTYYLTVTNSAGCSATDSVIVTMLPLPNLDAGNDVALCPSESVTLHASGGTSYTWSPGDGLSCTDCADPVASPKSTARYYVTTTNAQGCSATDSVTVTVIDVASVDAGVAAPICSGDSVQLQASDGATWQWSPADGLSCTDCRSPIANPSKTTVYTVTVSAAGGCSGSDTVSVTVLPLPVIAAGEDIDLCIGETTQLDASGGASYRWSPPDGLSCTDCANPIASPAVTTTYTVTGTGADGCTAGDAVTVTVGGGRTVQAHIERNHHLLPGTSTIVPVVLDEPITSISSTLLFTMNYNRGMLRLRKVETTGTLLDGWQQSVIVDTLGGIALRYDAIGGGQPVPAGTLLSLRFDGYVGDTITSELPFSVELLNQQCVSVATSAGRMLLDSICGLSYRMIEIGANKYALKSPRPNPFNPSTEIEFSLGLDGPTRLEVLNAAGERVAVLMDEYMQPGGYAVRWDAGAMPSGLYYVRLTSGVWTEMQSMVLVK